MDLSTKRSEMKIRQKSKSSPVTPQAGPDIAAAIDRIQQQLVFLEKKIDTLISQSAAKPPEARHFSKPFQRFDHAPRHGEGKQDGGFRERTLHKAICADCNKECEVPFRPSGDRPVYCRECFAKRKGNEPFKATHDHRPREESFSRERHFEKRRGGEHRKSAERKKPAPRRGKGRA